MCHLQIVVNNSEAEIGISDMNTTCQSFTDSLIKYAQQVNSMDHQNLTWSLSSDGTDVIVQSPSQLAQIQINITQDGVVTGMQLAITCCGRLQTASGLDKGSLLSRK